MSEVRRIHRKRDRTPEELAELKAERERFARDRPKVDELLAPGKYDGPFRHGDVMNFMLALATLKRARERAGLTLAQVSEASGLDAGMVSRLENGKVPNPTVSTLWRYARAVGGELRLDAHIPEGVSQSSPRS